jgi:Ser/Thr protein kinase RdoA (MazF antagonist)
MPQALPQVAAGRAALLAAAVEGPIGVVHSDLHREHLLVGPDRGLSGLLDFGDAFVGAVAWDYALLNWYYGTTISRQVADRRPDGRQLHEHGALLALAVGLYKLAKSPGDPRVRRRLRRVLGG